MSTVEFKTSITPTELNRWVAMKDSTITSNLITVQPGGYIEYSFIPLSDEQRFITSKYRLLIKYKSNGNIYQGEVSCLFDMILLSEGDDTNSIKYQTISARASDNRGNLVNDVIFMSSGGTADAFKFRFRNNGTKAVEIESIELFPSYSLNTDTINVVQQMLPSITHYSNTNTILAFDKETLLATVRAGTTSDTSLSLHCLINGWSLDNTTVTIYLRMNDIDLQYSPIKVDIPSGNFLISIPASIMRVKPGRNELKVLMMVDSGKVIIEPNRVQCSLEGVGLMSGGGSARPSAYVSERYNLTSFNVDNKLSHREDEVRIRIQKPIDVIIANESKLTEAIKPKSLDLDEGFDIELNHR